MAEPSSSLVTSTPMVTEIRRRTMLLNTNTPSPLRRSLNPMALNSSFVELPNDDDQRAVRRSIVQTQKRLTAASPIKSVNLSESFIKDQYVVYTHLFAENKITAKNAWKLQIIDMLKPLCEKSGKDVLQVASTSIDISAKVYGIRVDDIHSEGLKLANNMARVTNANPAENEEGEHSEGEQADAATTSKKKKRKRPNQTGVKSTINKNPKGNLGKLPKLEPTDFTTRVKPDAGTVDNLFTNMLKETSNCFILLDKSKKFFEESDSIVKQEDKISLKNITIPKTVGSINPSFNDFIVDVWDPVQEEKQDNEKSLLSQIQPVVFDDHGFPIPELDGSIHDIFEANDMDVDMDDDDEVMEVQQANSLLPQLRDAHVVDYRPMEMSIQTSEYSFNPVVRTSNGKYIDQIWAGPSHWKLKFIRRSTPRFSGRAASIEKPVKKGRKKAEVMMINFEGNPPEIDFNNQLVIKKRPPVVDIHKITLPLMDQSCARIMETIKELMLKPGVCPVEKNSTVKKEENNDEFEVSPYKYENPNDSMYCSQNQDNDMDMDNRDMDDDNIVGDDEHLVQFGGNLADNLVENPEMVPNTYIQFAKKAKQINMKKLKGAIWYKLTNVITETQDKNEKIIPQTYSEMYKALPDIMPSKEVDKLSCPLSFFALLHLANENNLSLTQIPGKNDCYIKGPQ